VPIRVAYVQRVGGSGSLIDHTATTTSCCHT
jgi:hypothetical protein